MTATQEKKQKKSPQEKKNPISHAKWLEYKKKRNARKKLDSKNVKAGVLDNVEFLQSKNDVEYLCEVMNKYLEKYLLENKGNNTNDGEVRGITKYEPETMKGGFILEHQVCGTIITEGKPNLTGTFIKEGIANHNC